MTLQEILASLLNPNGSQQAAQMGGAPAQVGDHANPALLMQAQQRLAQPPQMQPQQQAMPPQAPQGQPMPQNAPQPALGANGGGLGAIGGILQSIIAPQSAQKNKTVGWLTSQGLDQGTATVLASDKTALRQYIMQRSQGQKPIEIAGRLVDPNTYQVLADFSDKAPKQTSDMQEYELAKTQGFKGSFFDYQVKMKEAGRSQVNVDTGAKLPAGYVWNDPNNQDAGVHPIAGGPATVLPSEAAGRIGLADSFLKNFDTIRGKVASGVVTGPIDRFQATNNSSSDAGQIYQSIQTGVDSLQRMLTGAGMPASEASQYAFRYLPTYTDTSESMVAKLDRLKSELESVQDKVLQGREAPTTPQAQAPKDNSPPPATYDGDPKLWQYMTPEQRKLWQ